MIRLNLLMFLLPLALLSQEIMAMCMEGTEVKCVVNGKPGTRWCSGGRFTPCMTEPTVPSRQSGEIRTTYMAPGAPFNLVGTPYRAFEVPLIKQPDPVGHPAHDDATAMLCDDACAEDNRCQAWAYDKTSDNRRGHCRLFDIYPEEDMKTSCCISGRKVAIMAGMEWNTDRPGQDYLPFGLPANPYYLPEDNPALCQDLCAREGPKCQAWTYGKVKRDCWLKDLGPNKLVPLPRYDSCCISGVKLFPPRSH